MKSVALAALVLVFATHPSGAQGISPPEVPTWADSVFRHSLQFSGYDYESFNPSMAIADFDGDGLDDVAVEVRARDGLQHGLALIHHGDGSVHILGAGRDVGDGNDEIRDWSLIRLERHKVGIRVSRAFAPGGLLAWDGQTYHWTPAQ